MNSGGNDFRVGALAARSVRVTRGPGCSQIGRMGLSRRSDAHPILHSRGRTRLESQQHEYGAEPRPGRRPLQKDLELQYLSLLALQRLAAAARVRVLRR